MSNSNIVIMGPAGTGKTFLLRNLLEALGNKRVVYCAPTHAAKQVLQETLGQEAYTIHSLLKIHPETYEDTKEFKQSSAPDLESIDYLVIDEVSMLDGHITDIMMRSIHMGCRVIALGDPYQIQPVKNEPGILSPVFFRKDFERVVLREIVRQAEGNPIIEVATKIRKEGSHIFEFISEEDPTIGVFRHYNLQTFMTKYFEHVKTREDLLKYKLLAYVNDDVDRMNGFVRKRIYQTEEPVVVGEYLVMQEPVYQELEHDGIRMVEMKFHNGQTCEVMRIDHSGSEVFKLDGVDHLEPITIHYHKLLLRSIDEDIEYPVNVILDKESEYNLSEYLNYAAMHYKRMGRNPSYTQYAVKKLWKTFWALKGNFKEVKGAAACTFHKSQGSTFEGAFIFTNKLSLADPKIRRQLEYVGVTRARKFVHFV